MYIDTYLRNLSTHYLAVTDTIGVGDADDERYAHDHTHLLAMRMMSVMRTTIPTC